MNNSVLTIKGRRAMVYKERLTGIDTSMKYVVMCSRASWIQNRKKDSTCVGRFGFIPGDYFAAAPIGESYTIHMSIDGSNGEIISRGPKKINKSEDYPVWLPTQRNLQEMLVSGDNPHFRNKKVMLRGFMEFIYGDSEYYNLPPASTYASLEKLWLLFVMKVQYDKYWNDKNELWISL